MEQLHFGDLEAWKAYQAQIIARTAIMLDGLTLELLAEVLMPKLPPNMQNVFCGLVTGPEVLLRKLEVLEYFVYQQGDAHGQDRACAGAGGAPGMTSGGSARFRQTAR